MTDREPVSEGRRNVSVQGSQLHVLSLVRHAALCSQSTVMRLATVKRVEQEFPLLVI